MSSLKRIFLVTMLIATASAFTRANPRPYFTEPSLSPDRKEIAFVSGGDIWTVPATGGVAALLVSHTANEARPLFSPDGKQLAFISNRAGNGDIYLLTLATGELKRLTFDDVLDQLDGWSRDGRWIYFSSGSRDVGGLNDLYRVSVNGGTPMLVSADRYTNEFYSAPSPDGKTLAFTARGIASGQWWRKGHSHIDESELWLLRSFDAGAGTYERLTARGAKELWPMWSGDGRSLFYVSDRTDAGNRNGAQNIWAQFSPDNKEIFFIENGRIGVVNLEGRSRTLAVTAEMDVDFSREKMEVFRQGWSYLRDFFYDPEYHGANWNAVRAEYEPLIAGARTSDEMRRLLQLMVGELNASHLGAGAPPGGNPPTTGRIGLRFDRREYESNGRLRITEVIALSPAAIVGNVSVGDYLLAVDGRSIERTTNVDELLNYKIGRRVSLTVSSDGVAKREVVVRPVNAATERGLLYRQWVERNREYVSKASNGRLGYAHMFDMSGGSLNQLHIDLDAENYGKDGVVIDIRNNGGGFVNVYAIDVFARRNYLTMTLRGLSGTPARTVLGQRALNRPTILVTNQHSLSDAEDFTEGYRTLKLGQVVGEPTAGWIIYTWNQSLIDGTTFRLPRMKITANDGTNMERNPRPVDIEVTRPIGETLTDRDSQLDAAVRELLKQLGSQRSTSPR